MGLCFKVTIAVIERSELLLLLLLQHHNFLITRSWGLGTGPGNLATDLWLKSKVQRQEGCYLDWIRSWNWRVAYDMSTCVRFLISIPPILAFRFNGTKAEILTQKKVYRCIRKRAPIVLTNFARQRVSCVKETSILQTHWIEFWLHNHLCFHINEVIWKVNIINVKTKDESVFLFHDSWTRNKFHSVSRLCRFLPVEKVAKRCHAPVLPLALESAHGYSPPVSFFRVPAGQKEPWIYWVFVCVYFKNDIF